VLPTVRAGANEHDKEVAMSKIPDVDTAFAAGKKHGKAGRQPVPENYDYSAAYMQGWRAGRCDHQTRKIGGCGHGPRHRPQEPPPEWDPRAVEVED